MKSVIICEGSTDLALIQYYLEETYNWVHIKKANYKNFAGAINPISGVSGLKWFEHNNGSIMSIISAGGVSKIDSVLRKVLDINNVELATDRHFARIVIISDRDEVETEGDFIDSLTKIFLNSGVKFGHDISNNNWNYATFKSSIGEESNIGFLPLIIPFEDTGAIETFLLKALSDESEKRDPEKIDKCVIEQCIKFIDEIDCKGKYLNKRRHITKAKFNTVFTVMAPAEAFNKRDSLLRDVPWEQYTTVQSAFKKLDKLSVK